MPSYIYTGSGPSRRLANITVGSPTDDSVRIYEMLEVGNHWKVIERRSGFESNTPLDYDQAAILAKDLAENFEVERLRSRLGR